MTWAPIKLGNGGLVIQFDIALDGTMVCGTDSFGGYVWSSSANQWQQILTTTRMPSSVITNYLNGSTGSVVGGFDAVAVDPSHSGNIWIYHRGNLYKSTDTGATFSTTGFTTQPPVLTSISGDARTKNWGPYIAVDPNNSLVVYVSTSSQGLFRTIDGGSNFTLISTFSGGMPDYDPVGHAPTVLVSAGTNGTDSITVGTGTQAFNHNSGSFGFSLGDYVKVWRTSDVSVQMLGTVSASSGTTFSLSVTTAFGSGTFTDWTVSFNLTDTNSNAGHVGGGHRICFDTSASTVANPLGGSGAVTKNIFVHTYGVNTWKSTDGGSSWTATSATNRPIVMKQMACDPAGVLWVNDDLQVFGGFSTLNKYSGTAWTNDINTGGSSYWYSSLHAHPTASPAQICAVGGGPEIITLSVDGGSTWNNSGGTSGKTIVSSGDVDWIQPWLLVNQNSFANTVCRFDPVVSGKVWAPGEGVWYAFPPSSGSAVTITQQTRGIEEFVVIRILSTPSTPNAVLMSTWDFPLFYSNNFNAYPSAMTGQPGAAGMTSLLRGYDIDWAWNAPATIIAIVADGTGSNPSAQNYTSITTTGGATTGAWTRLSDVTDITVGGDAGGNIAIKDANNMVYVITASGGAPKHTTDGGASWATISIPAGTPTTSWGPIANYSPEAKTIVSDKGNGDIYLFNINVNGGGSQGMYRSTDGGTTWTIRTTPTFDAEFNINESMKSSGITGCLMFAGGQQGASYPTTTRFYYTNDGWNTANTVTNFRQVLCYGFGAASVGQTYPNIYAAGWYNGTATTDYGIWMCQNFDFATGTGTWTKLGGVQFPMGVMGFPKDIDGDKVTPGKVYIITNGGAFFFGPDVGPTGGPFGFSVITDSGQRRTKMIGY